MEEFNIQGKQTSFYKYCPGTFGYTVVDNYITTFQAMLMDFYIALLTTKTEKFVTKRYLS